MKNYIPLVAVATGFALNLLLTPLLILLAKRFQWYDSQDHRKTHGREVPRIGGVGIAITFFVAIVLFFRAALPPISSLQAIVICLGAAAIHAIGLIDDIFEIKAWPKLVVQLAAAIAVIAGGLRFESIWFPFLSHPTEIGLLSYPLTLLWIIVITNSINLIDGVDGLAGGIGFIIFFIIGMIALTPLGNSLLAIPALVLLGGMGAFLIFNAIEARIFMGDSGSLFLGFIIALAPLIDRTVPGFSLFPVATLLCVPLLDVGKAIVRRLRRRTSIYTPDRGHIHHNILDMGYSDSEVCIYLYGVTLVAILAVIAWFHDPGIVGGIALLTAWCCAGVTVWLFRSDS